MTTYVVSSGTTGGGTPSFGDQIEDYGTTVAVTLGSFSYEDVYSGGVANSTLLNGFGAILTVYNGGSINQTSATGGTVVVSSGGTATATRLVGIITAAAQVEAEMDLHQAVASGGYVAGESSLHLFDGSVATSFTLSSGGYMTVSGGSIAKSITVDAGANLQVYSGSAIGTILLGGDAGVIGTRAGFTYEYVSAGASTTGTSVGSRAFQNLDGGTAVGAVVNSGGRQNVNSGSALNDKIQSGGIAFVDLPGTLLFTEAAGQTNTVAGSLSGSGRVVQSGPGTLLLSGDASNFSGTYVVAGGTVEATAAALGTTGAVQFTAAGTLAIDGLAAPGEVLVGFGAGDILDLKGLAYAPGGTVSVGITVFSRTIDSAGVATSVNYQQVTVQEGGASETLLMAAPVAGSFALASDGQGTTLTTTACYASGTLILTAVGERPVEALVIGDVTVTASGQLRPVKWIGRRSYAGRFLLANTDVQPIRVHAGSLGYGLPRRDLLVSPDHAMFLDGVLIPARHLVNATTIIRERPTRVDYYHVELDSHDVLLAEGAPSESFMDDDSRGVFHNAAEFPVLYPDALAPAGYCARRVESGAELEAVRRRLAAVAAERTRAA